MPERAPAEPSKLLQSWMEWETGQTPPGRVMSNLKTAGLRELLEVLIEAQRQAANVAAGSSDPAPDA